MIRLTNIQNYYIHCRTFDRNTLTIEMLSIILHVSDELRLVTRRFTLHRASALQLPTVFLGKSSLLFRNNSRTLNNIVNAKASDSRDGASATARARLRHGFCCQTTRSFQTRSLVILGDIGEYQLILPTAQPLSAISSWPSHNAIQMKMATLCRHRNETRRRSL